MSYNILPVQLPLFKRRHPMRYLMLGFYQQKQTSVTGGNINPQLDSHHPQYKTILYPTAHTSTNDKDLPFLVFI